MNLSVIIVSYNTKDFLRRCLESVIKSQESGVRSRESAITEIIVVDNGSTDGSKEYLRNLEQKRFRSIEKTKEFSKSLNVYNSIALGVIFNKENLGFAKAVNQGIKKSSGDYLLLLNSDIVAKPKALEKMVDFAKKNPEVRVIGGRLLNPDNSIQASVYHFPTIWRAIREYWFIQKGAFEKYVPSMTGVAPVSVKVVTGAVMLIHRKTIEEIGFFDERYFMYFEDLDYCRRVKKAGFKVYYLPKAEFIHHHGVSGKMIPEKTHQWLVEGSKIYHGKFKYYLLTFIIWTGQKWQKFWQK